MVRSENLSGGVVREVEAAWHPQASGLGTRLHAQPACLFSWGLDILKLKECFLVCGTRCMGWVLNPQWVSRDFRLPCVCLLDDQSRAPTLGLPLMNGHNSGLGSRPRNWRFL